MQDRQLDISIIIPVYNVEPYIEKCLRSVMEQEGCEGIFIECLVVDDRGTDNSIAVARSLIQSYSGPIEFRIITREQNGGLSAARNSGIREARGRYLYFLDSDDWISIKCMALLWKEVRKHPGVDIVYGKTVCSPDPEFMNKYFDFKLKGADAYCNNILTIRSVHFKFPVTAWNKLIKTQFLIDYELFFCGGVIHEDDHWHLHSYGYIKSYACLLDAEPTYYYYQREGSIINTIDNNKNIEAYYKIHLDLSKKLKIWDKRICRRFLDELFELRGLGLYDCYKKLLNSVLSNRHLPSKAVVLFRYMNSPRVMVYGKIAYWYLSLFTDKLAV